MRKSLGKLLIAILYTVVLMHKCSALAPKPAPRLQFPTPPPALRFDGETISLPASLARSTSGDVALFRERFVAKGLKDPATELDEELFATLDDWNSDCAIAQEWRTREDGNYQWLSDPLRQWRVDGIVAKLSPAAGLPGPAIIEIFHGPVNAFTPGGNRLFVSDAMLDLMDDDELSAVLAHEMGHIVARHPLRQRRLAEALKNVPLAQGAEQVEYGLAMLLYSRICEAEADTLGVVILQRAGMGDYDGVTHMTKMPAAPDACALKDKLAELERALEPLETAETQAEQEFNRTKTSQSFERLAGAKAEAQKARAERDAYKQALDSSTRKSEWTHPDFSERIPRWQEAYKALKDRLALPSFLKGAPSDDVIVGYVIEAAGHLWNF